METEEQWRPVVGYEGEYEVSDYGRVRSLKHDEPRVLSTPLNSSGYPTIGLMLNGKRRSRPVHSLVLEAFSGPRPDGQVSRHLDGDRMNNHASNLRWGTYSENAYDAVRHGTYVGNTRDEECAKGHPRTPENLYVTPKGARRCRPCDRFVRWRRTGRERASRVLGAFLYPDEPTEDATRKGSEFLIRKLREGQ